MSSLSNCGIVRILPITAQPMVLRLPLYNLGSPSPADDYLEKSLDLNEHVAQQPAATFFLEVEGHSMAGAGIQHGDMLIVDRSLEPKDGAIVIAVVNGEWTVKRLKRRSKRVWLVTENSEFSPLEITESLELNIWGVVTHVVHSL